MISCVMMLFVLVYVLYSLVLNNFILYIIKIFFHNNEIIYIFANILLKLLCVI